MNFGHTVRRVVVVVIAVGFLQGCMGNSQPAPDETHKIAPPATAKKLQESLKKKGKLVPKSIKDRD